MISNNWIDHALRRTPWRNQRQAFALMTLGFFVAMIIGALYLSQAAAVATTGRQLEELINERTRLEQMNEQLRGEIAGLLSVPNLQQRARELGFELAGREDIEYLVIDGYDPTRSRTPVRLEVESVAAPVYEETFSGWLQQQWDAFTGQSNAASEPEVQ
ncbi:MAG: hypothetical protein CL610_01940 [Anaerolineaceae bacterium]|nr:hypothetical protein [Anaerolineaceae bacterium]